MATYLYRLGLFSFRQRRLVVALWLVVLTVVGVGAATLSGPTTDSFSIPGTESQKALDLLGQRFPAAAASGAIARVVLKAPAGTALTDPASKAVVEQTVAELNGSPQVAAVRDPFASGAVSPDGTTAYITTQYTVQSPELTVAARTALLDTAQQARDAGLTVEIGGDAALAPSEAPLTEVLGVAVAAVVLAITFGSMVAAGLPLLTALLGVGIGIAGITAASGFFTLSSTAPVLALMLGLAVAIDYALFIVSRYRTELAHGRRPEEAIGHAVGTAGSAVVFAGLTVVIALSGLAVVGIPFLTAMGIAAAATVAVSVLIALTLLPATLGFAGLKVMKKGQRAELAASPAGTPLTVPATRRPAMGVRWATFVTRRPAWVLATAVLGLGLVAMPALSLETGLPDESSAAPDTTQRKAYDLLSEGFGAGFNGPLTIVVDAQRSSDKAAAFAAVGTTLAALPDVVNVTPAVPNAAGDTAIITVIPASGPSSTATKALVGTIRDASASITATTGAELQVTGQTAVAIDVSNKLSSALPPYLLLIVGLAIVLLMLVFRSVLVPIKATLGFLLTIAATFGAVVAVFQWGWLAGLFGVTATGPIMSLLPIFMVGILFGLAMDYQVFLVTRMREDFVHGASPKESVIGGFEHSARVVTAAAIIMVAVFAGFLLTPEPIIKSIGFALAFGIIIDAFVVRMTIVPAVMALVGKAAWWMPAWLDRLLPDVDVEGQKLATMTPARADEDTAEIREFQSAH